MNDKTKRNARINRALKSFFDERNIRTCELGLPGCAGSQPPLDFAHSKRRWKWETKEDETSAVLSCRNCHNNSDAMEDHGEKVILEAIGNRV